MGKAIDGLFIVDKPEGVTSLDVVREVKRRLHVKKAGHVGTLDPFATGVLPVVINEGTKLVPFLEDEPKEYEATLKFGEETRTDDLTGEVVAIRPWEGLKGQAIEEAFQSFLGRIHQIPPMFSAVKVQGMPLYRLARNGIEVERKAREVNIFNMQIEGIDLPQVRFRVSCSKGTYIRTLGFFGLFVLHLQAHPFQFQKQLIILHPHFARKMEDFTLRHSLSSSEFLFQLLRLFTSKNPRIRRSPRSSLFILFCALLRQPIFGQR